MHKRHIFLALATAIPCLFVGVADAASHDIISKSAQEASPRPLLRRELADESAANDNDDLDGMLDDSDVENGA